MSPISALIAGVPVSDLDAGIDWYIRFFGRPPDMRAGDEVLWDVDAHATLFIEPDRARIKQLVDQSVMLVTALNRKIGYDNAAKIAKNAHKTGTTLRESAIELRLLTGEEFDKEVRPENMVGPLKG